MLKKLLGSLALGVVSQAAAGATYYTAKCAQYGHAEFQVSITDKAIPRTDVEWFLSTLEGMVAAGEKFKPGETMQIGWIIAKIEQGDKGALRLLEPDMKAIPVKFVDSVDATVRHLRAQKDSVESVLPGSALLFPSLRQSAVVHIQYKHARKLVLQRLSPRDSDSGWWLSDPADPSGAKDPNKFVKISLYQLALDRPDLVKFFAFPVGAQLVIDQRINVLKDGFELPIKPGSFIDLLNRQGASR